MATSLPQPTLLAVATHNLSAVERALFRATLVVAGTLLLALSAKLQLPFWPVPMTMQSFAVIALAMAFGWRLGVFTVLAYLAEGAAGMQVFAAGSGPAYLAGPTGGYLAGFVASAFACGRLAERGWGRDPWRGAAAMAIGHALIFLLGWAWLAVLVGPAKAYAAGVEPFYAATLAKTLLGLVTLPLAWRVLKKTST
jgi:biotin transport system substrate-specific component